MNAREFGRALRHNLPKMMFIFLPLIALVSLVLYAFRRRTYVEHLLFYVHYHAFAFLLLTPADHGDSASQAGCTCPSYPGC